MPSHVPPRNKRGGLRTGFTTGACAAAAAKAATRCLVQNRLLSEIETTLPNRQTVVFSLARCERNGAKALCSVIKDAGDDPDCTHGAELVAEVRLQPGEGVELCGGEGVATVTKPGLGLEVGSSAINPVPRRNITEMVLQELALAREVGAIVTISVPAGIEMAKQTINERLGLMGGISILGTTGIVRPYSTAAFKASVIQAIDVAQNRDVRAVVLTTGGKSETWAMTLFPSLPVEAFIQVGDFVGVGLRHCRKRGLRAAHIVGMIGKLSKMANGKMQTHAAGSQVNMELLAELARHCGGADSLTEAILAAATARRVLELCQEAGLPDLATVLCRRVVDHAERHAGPGLAVSAHLFDFSGLLLGSHPPRGTS